MPDQPITNRTTLKWPEIKELTKAVMRQEEQSPAMTNAAKLVDYLFTNGAGQEADRLVLTKDNDRTGHGRAATTDLGGWGRSSVLAAVEQLVVSVKRETWREAGRLVNGFEVPAQGPQRILRESIERAIAKES